MEVTYTTKEPIAMIICKMKMALFTRNPEGEFLRTKKILDIGEVRSVYGVLDEKIELESGLYIDKGSSLHLEINYGTLTVESPVYTCSRNGYKIRKLESTKEFRVINILTTSTGVILYQINAQEYVQASPSVRFSKISGSEKTIEKHC